jgi:ATP:ADP antiporter, AAA family
LQSAREEGWSIAAFFRKLLLLRPGEGRALAWSALYFFFLLLSYFILRPVREAMGIDRSADDLPWLMTGTMAAMLLANPLFAWMVARFPRRVFIPAMYFFFASNLGLFFALSQVLPETRWLGYAFYIWLSVFNLFSVSLFWAVMADGFSSEQSQRLFGVVGVGGTIGAISGGLFTRAAIGTVGSFGLMLVSAGLLLVVVFCVWRVMRVMGISGARRDRVESAASAEPGPGVLAGVRLISKSPYLLMICVYLFLYTTLSTFLYMHQGRVIELAAPDRESRAAIFATIDIAANVLTLVTQLFLTSRIVRGIGVGPTLAILPTVSIIGFAALWAAPGMGLPILGTLIVFQVARRGLHIAVSRPAREMLFTVLGQDEKYKSKPFIDTFVYRGGDLFGAWSPKAIVAFAGTRGISALSAIPMAAMPLAAISLVVALVLGRMHRRKAAADQKRGEMTEAMRPVMP